MKLALLYLESVKDRLDVIKNVLEEIGIEVQVYEFSTDWHVMTNENIAYSLSTNSHMLIWVAQEIYASSWFSFALGFGLGRHESVYLHRCSDEVKLPGWLKALPNGNSLDDVKNYYKTEVELWRKEQKTSKAKNKLVEQGFAITSEAFSNCVIEGDLTSVELYLEAGFSANTNNEKGIPILALAVRHKHKRLLPLLLSNGADLNAQSDDRHNTAIMDAAAEGDIDILEFLLRQGANLDFQSKSGQSALILAAGQGHTKAAALLIHAGADVTLSDKLGMSAKKYAQLFRNEELLSMIAEVEGNKS